MASLNQNQQLSSNNQNNTENEMKSQKPNDTEASPLTEKSPEDDPRDLESASKSKGRISFDSVMERIRQSKRSRLLYVATVCLCAILLVIIIFLIAFWPHVPFYLKAEICVDKECMVASQQLLLWSNSSNTPCTDAFSWACGDFKKEYDEGNFYAIDKGEWDAKGLYEYEDLRELNVFISMLPIDVVSYSVESLMSGLYKSCRDIELLDKSVSDLVLKKAIMSVDGWRALRDGSRLHNWDFRKALLHLHSIYGIFPFFKVTLENRNNKPFEYIITLDEGDIGLPDKYFYNADINNGITKAYKMLLRDFAINMGIVAQEADSFADEIFHYEKRIVNEILSSSEEFEVNQIKTIDEIKGIAPSLPIFDSIKAIFPEIKVTEDTEILVKNPRVLTAMSVIVASSDRQPLNDFIIWSLVRNLLPYLSREYRILSEKFDQSLYGQTDSNPRWLTCTKLVRDWLSFGVDALQQNPGLVKSSSPTNSKSLYSKKRSTNSYPNKTNGNDELLRLIFYNIRNQVQETVRNIDWIQPELKSFIVGKLTEMRLQIGIPDEVLDAHTYINEFYKYFLLQPMYFADHVKAKWSFRKLQLSAKLNPLGIVDMIISEFYANDDFTPITYSARLNMILISKRLYQSNYYDYRFPISVNFARIGADLVEIFLQTIDKYVQQYEEETNQTFSGIKLFKLHQQCIEDDVNNMVMPEDVMSNLHVTLSAAKISARALSSFIVSIDNKGPIAGASINPALTYEMLGLANRKRLPGLRSLNENELFTLAYLQTHCNTPITDKDFSEIKPHVQRKIAESQLFEIVWKQVPFLPLSMSCSSKSHKCTNIL